MIDDFLDASGIFRVLKFIFVELLFDIFCYVVGWLFLKLLTLGRYPRSGLVEGMKESHSEDAFVSIVGLILVFLCGWLVFS